MCSDRPLAKTPPASPERRNLLLGLAGGVGYLASNAESAAAPQAPPAAPQAPPAAPETPPAAPVKPLTVAFHGPNQAGITTPQPFSCLVASFDLLVEKRDELATLLKDLTGLLRLLAEGGDLPQDDPRLPPSDNGLLGTHRINPERLTATVALGASAFDERFGLAPLRPRQLVEMTAFPNDALDDTLCHGDLLIQFCAETPEEVIHALRLVLKATPDRLAIKWKQEGFAATHGARSGPLGTGRNLLGFKDGTANADVANAALMNDYVWVRPGAEEPAWTAGGSYQVVRLIRNYVEFWDRTPLGEQQRIFGRDKTEGAPLGHSKEFDPPNYAADPGGDKVPLSSHIRLANPRTPRETARLIRRGYNYSNGVTKSGQLDMGLLFVSFQSDLERGFLSTQTRLNGEPLEEYIKPFGGGYFFALPGVASANAALGESLFAAASALKTPAPAGDKTKG
ncbi:deferrochelatase/peroxidase EfeB [Rhodoblastus sphagnicola]|uniref:Deferrochelatase n=1 Tax=Rhodoblastus sphagnicola TaxID=333368 RepID=A0A2S6MXA0_9HYPH|nr:iron uptake transporter deferrochelatase/peroxidase subunit [Rhodoblastus sphagnicola]MBB4199314.1 deferrochelatase/peroxidase EfeB [Rhodoblastus sphagnicola]PPQ26978.1 deferrochelatase/peroxidase EfeB [Rhodoblastus sphagnicola]